ncbi:MAG: hypothetical protein KGI37_08590 [Alphaproteobacteria bacterium]|nr:hypothetical protein [Alphaproteobacteria bacterium]
MTNYSHGLMRSGAGSMLVLALAAVLGAAPAYAASAGGFNSTTDDVTFSANGSGIMALHDGKTPGTSFGVTFSGPITEGGSIFNTNGTLGVGTMSPKAELDVNGAVRASAANIVVNTACSPEGAMAYDESNHVPVYCSSGGLWTNTLPLITVLHTCNPTPNSDAANVDCFATCPTGTYVITGGCWVGGWGTSTPSSNQPWGATQWHCSASKLGAGSLGLQVTVVCSSSASYQQVINQ